MTAIEPGGIDCDLHPAVPNLKALHPYLTDHWRDIVNQRQITQDPAMFAVVIDDAAAADTVPLRKGYNFSSRCPPRASGAAGETGSRSSRGLQLTDHSGAAPATVGQCGPLTTPRFIRWTGRRAAQECPGNGARVGPHDFPGHPARRDR